MKVRYTHPYPRMNISLDKNDIRDLMASGWFRREPDNYQEGITLALDESGENHLMQLLMDQFDLGTKSNEGYLELSASTLDCIHRIWNTALQYEAVAEDPAATESDILEFRAKASGLKEALRILDDLWLWKEDETDGN